MHTALTRQLLARHDIPAPIAGLLEAMGSDSATIQDLSYCL